MPTEQQLSKIASCHKLEAFNWTPGATAATAFATRFDMRDYESIGFLVLAADLTGVGVTKLEIVGYTAAAGGAAVPIVERASLAPDADGDYVFIEATAEQMGALGDLRYATIRSTTGNAADALAVFVIRTATRHAKKALTADSIA